VRGRIARGRNLMAAVQGTAVRGAEGQRDLICDKIWLRILTWNDVGNW
jgi:hypothetical protein